MGFERYPRRRVLRIAAALCVVAGGIVGASPVAHAVTPGPIATSEDDYTADGVGAFMYVANGSYAVDAAHGLLVNDSGPSGTKVDLSQTVDDPSGPDTHLVTTQDQSYSVHIAADGHFTYCAGFF